ncbi:MAG TPA: hypothetical protein VH597_17280 [Verrucomicrobiae bacterium]|jgi:hypothetical protein|nr:hypothetical protein [Verrucomicrobiae bacterium]
MEPLNIRKIAVATAILIACAAPQARGNGVYLKQIGPSPLRFSMATAAFSFTLPAVLMGRPAVTNSAEIGLAKTTSADTNAVTVPASPLPSDTTANTIPTIPNPILPNNAATTPSASDLLVVSPQMLTEFFKPGQNGTNTPSAVVVPPHVGFTPPSVMPPSSQAIYKVQ